MASRSEDRQLGISKPVFQNYYNLPGIIGDRLYAFFDTNSNGHIDLREFVASMTLIFSGEFKDLAAMAFHIFDFDSDELITQSDVRTVLSYIPINSSYKEKRLKLERCFLK